MPPPPAIGSVRPPKGEPADASGGRGEPLDESATQRWPALGAELAEDDGPTEDVGSRSLPIGGARPRVPAPPVLGPSASASASGLKVPSLGPPTAVGAASESAGSWPRTDGWDLDDEAGSENAGSSVPQLATTATNAASSVPSVPKPVASKELGSVPSVPKLGSIPSVPKPGATKPGATPKPAPAAREVGSVPTVPKLGSLPKVAPLPKHGGSKPAPAARHGRAAEAEEDVRPLFGTALADDGSLAAGLGASTRTSASDAGTDSPLDAWASFSTPSVDTAAIDASAPPSSASPLDALPSFDTGPPLDGVPQGDLPSLDSSMLLGAALEPVGDFEPTPVQSGLAPIIDADDEDPAPSVPRLPVPGMLRDGLAPAADFRATPRTPRSPQPPPAMVTPRGMIPPKHRDGEEPRLELGDTQALVARVAEELIEEVDRQRAEQAAAAASHAPHLVHDREAAVAMTAAAGPAAAWPAARPATAASAVPMVSAYASTRAAESKRRSMVLGIGAMGVAVAIGLWVWLGSDRSGESPTPMVAATVPPTPPAPSAEGDATVKPEPPVPTPAPEVAAAAEAATSTSGPAEAEPAAAASTGGPEATAEGEADEGAAGEAAPETPKDAAGEPEPAASGDSGSSSRKSSDKRRGSGGKSNPAETTTKHEPAPPPKTDEAPSAAKLLKQARSAYNAGKGSTAYSLASKSNRMEPSGEAAEVMALAACQMNDAGKAKAALKTVPLFSRTSVRSTCKSKHGVKLGL